MHANDLVLENQILGIEIKTKVCEGMPPIEEGLLVQKITHTYTSDYLEVDVVNQGRNPLLPKWETNLKMYTLWIDTETNQDLSRNMKNIDDIIVLFLLKGDEVQRIIIREDFNFVENNYEHYRAWMYIDVKHPENETIDRWPIVLADYQDDPNILSFSIVH